MSASLPAHVTSISKILARLFEEHTKMRGMCQVVAGSKIGITARTKLI